ncbi:MAG: hypothetical protein E6G94_11070 [Alphaproteobacteria bacterium]|nr:MAG: hypothetical protein E6G94_11070 [Alphaproteobacteria bacterium]
MCALAVLAIPVCASAKAPVMPPVYTFSERDDDDSRTCALSSASAIDAVNSALQANGVALATRKESLGRGAISAYINLASLPLQGASSDCAISINLTFEKAIMMAKPGNKKRQAEMVKFCDRGYLMTSAPESAVRKVNGHLEQFVADCVREYLMVGLRRS